MGIMRALRRRQRKAPPVDKGLAEIAAGVEELATHIFRAIVTCEMDRPSSAAIETAMKAHMMDVLEPARVAAIDAGKPAAEIDAYAEVVSSYAQVVFQTKWAELERLHAQSPDASKAVH